MGLCGSKVASVDSVDHVDLNIVDIESLSEIFCPKNMEKDCVAEIEACASHLYSLCQEKRSIESYGYAIACVMLAIKFHCLCEDVDVIMDSFEDNAGFAFKEIVPFEQRVLIAVSWKGFLHYPRLHTVSCEI